MVQQQLRQNFEWILREAVILCVICRISTIREIAVVSKVQEETVKSRINRGRAELARVLQRTYLSKNFL